VSVRPPPVTRYVHAEAPPPTSISPHRAHNTSIDVRAAYVRLLGARGGHTPTVPRVLHDTALFAGRYAPNPLRVWVRVRAASTR
jgi:hypothetical protein